MKINIDSNEIRFMVISDLHLGSNYDRLDLVYRAYEYAYDHYIYHVINLGDLIDSVMPSIQRTVRITNINRQINYCIDKYPFFDDITTYMLYGNHDYYQLSKS